MVSVWNSVCGECVDIVYVVCGIVYVVSVWIKCMW